MTIVAVTRTLNEADIIEAFARHNAYFVDHQIFLDNGSVDGTIGIVKSLIAEGLGISLFQNHSRTFFQSEGLTFLYREAVRNHGADWVMFLDVDEFIDDRRLGCNLGAYLANFSVSNNELGCIKVRLRDYQMTPSDDPGDTVPRRMTECLPISDNWKIIVKGDLVDRIVAIQPGSHAATLDDGRECPSCQEPSLSYAHYPVRSLYQWLSKAIVGRAKILAAGPAVIATGFSEHYRDPFEILRTAPQEILRNPALLNPTSPEPGLIHDPIDYRGGQLRYTGSIDYQMRSVQVITQYLHDLATQHGEMMELVTKLSDVIRRDESEFRRLL